MSYLVLDPLPSMNTEEVVPAMSTFQINGFGVRDFQKTVSTGSFECANDQCKSKRNGELSQQYKMVTSKRWFTLLWVPVIPLGSQGSYVECKSCKASYSPSVLTGAAAQAA